MKNPEAAFICIGNEILSGKTRDVNVQTLAQWMGNRGICLTEVRIVADVHSAIISAVNQLRANFDYVFTSGGIGPTHDDITAQAIANAFGVRLELNEHAFAALSSYYKTAQQITDSRKKMAYIPQGAALVRNSISGAVGFRKENVFCLAGVPAIFQVMLDDIANSIIGGNVWSSYSIEVLCGESHIALELGEIQQRHPDVEIGSYPKSNDKNGFYTELVLRSADARANTAVLHEVQQMLKKKDITHTTDT